MLHSFASVALVIAFIKCLEGLIDLRNAQSYECLEQINEKHKIAYERKNEMKRKKKKIPWRGFYKE
jgi:hypothetical protein